MHRGVSFKASVRSRRVFGLIVLVALTAIATAQWGSPVTAGPSAVQIPFEIQALNGSGNNKAHSNWGMAGTNYSRVARARYADGASEAVDGPNARYVSNRVFNDTHQNLFSETGTSQWGFVWGQFLDHTFGLRLGRTPGDPAGEAQNIVYDGSDPLEEFENDLGVIPFVRSTAAPGTGVSSPREQVNTVSSYIDAFAVYGGSDERLEWLREGPVDGDLSNNSARLLLDENGLLPRRDERGDAMSAPAMEIDGRLTGQADQAAVAGDVRANENIALQATHTLFAREHNRIVSLLPNTLSEEDKFQIARRVVIAEQQYVTYNEFLPALGIKLRPYKGYNPNVNANLSNEFATVGYRAHSMIHGEVELETEASRYTPGQLEAFEAAGIEVELIEGEAALAVPLNVAFFNPDLVEQLQLGPLLQGIGIEPQYKNDNEIDNQLRSVLFQIPVSGNPECLDGEGLPECFDGVVDLGAIDIERGRDHGMPSYNDLRRAYGLEPKASFTAITGEASEEYPAGMDIDDPASLEVQELLDIKGRPIDLTDEEAVEADGITVVRGSTLAARLKAIYGSVDNLDAFTGMLSESHEKGSNFGELQRAIWERQFEALRSGDRFFYENDPGLSWIKETYGIDYRTNLGDVIARNTDIPRNELAKNVFLAP
jgi:Animal haem peroxidase